jgi:hypothetical protein
MAITNYGELKNKLSSTLFHTRFAPEYDDYTVLFEAVANRRLRVRQMEASIPLTTANGETPLPADYLTWRTVRPTLTPPFEEIDYVHPAYLAPVGRAFNRVFTIEGNTFKARPVDDRLDAYELHYYQKIPTVTGFNTNTNWLLTAHPDFYLAGVMTELFVKQRNMEGAQLEKARRDELMAEIIQLSALTTGATSPTARTAEYF